MWSNSTMGTREGAESGDALSPADPVAPATPASDAAVPAAPASDATVPAAPETVSPAHAREASVLDAALHLEHAVHPVHAGHGLEIRMIRLAILISSARIWDM